MLVWLHLWSRSGLVRHHAVHQPTSSLPWGSRCDIYDAGSPNLLISTLRISGACRQLVTFSDFILDLVFEVLQNLLLLYAWALNEIDDQHTLPIPLAPFSCRSCQISLSLASVLARWNVLNSGLSYGLRPSELLQCYGFWASEALRHVQHW